MKQIYALLIRTSGLIAIVLIGLFVLLALSNEEGVASSTLAEANVTTLAPVNDALLASVSDASHHGIYRSANGGRTWEMASRALDRPVNALSASLADPRTVYAGTEGGSLSLERDSLFVSHDAGRTWSRPPLMLPASPEGRLPTVLALAADPADPGTVYVGTDTQGLYKLSARGTTLEAVGADFYRARVEQVVVAPSNPKQVFAVTSSGLFASRDGGEAWSRLQSLPEHALSLAVAADNSDVLYAGTPSMGAYRSDDGGRSWEPIGQGLGLAPGVALTVRQIQVDAADSAHVVAAPAYVFPGSEARAVPLGIFESYDAGRTWTLAQPTSGVNEVNALVVGQQASAVYAATDRGIVRTDRASSPASLLDPLGAVFAGNATPGNALTRVSIILFTAMAGITVWLIKPAHLCGTFLQSLVGRSCTH